MLVVGYQSYLYFRDQRTWNRHKVHDSGDNADKWDASEGINWRLTCKWDGGISDRWIGYDQSVFQVQVSGSEDSEVAQSTRF